jgi:hypothetical protein
MERSSEMSIEIDPLDRLRAADPVRPDEVPAASLARVSARIQEHIVTDIQHTTTVTPSRRPFAILGGVVAMAALALAVGIGANFGLGSPGDVASNPGDPGNGAAGGGLASCLAYDPASLPMFDVVFDGTVTAVTGDQVTFDVNAGWKGADGSITLTAPDTDVALLGEVPDFEVGGRYLVTAAGSAINACGYTLDYDADTAADWAAAFAG